jgi:integrase/recombinase XerD
MARRPKPWFRKARRAWFVTIDGVQHNLGPEKGEAFERFFALMRQPKEQKVASRSIAAIADAYLEWVQKQRSPETYEWYR